jgi:hypothetical protein
MWVCLPFSGATHDSVEIIGTPQRLDDEARVTRSRLWVRSGLSLRKSVNCRFENEAFLPATETPQQSSRRRPMAALQGTRSASN